jgi:hypothetical protein
MGAVWLGHDELLDRPVALKQIGLLPGTDGTDLARAEREAQLAARFNHPHVVAVFDLVVDAEAGTWWLVMEYVDGTTLGRLVQERGRLSPDEAAPLLWQVADGLLAAHSAGIVHRDVKPSNVLIDHTGSAKLTDFGIARAAADPALTRTGLVTGSPAYLAPEVAAGGRGDEAADVWSLGATAFHVLAGRPPYEVGDHLLGGLYRIVNEEPPRLPEAGWLAPLLEATMVKDPKRRWSMAQVRDFLPRPGSHLMPIEPAVGPEREDNRKRAVVALVALALALAAALVLLMVLPGRGRSVDPAPTASASETAAAGPTARGMRSFVRAYVDALGSDLDAAWRMLTPRFQRESGGLATYRAFWSGVGEGRILEVSADPGTLVVSYRVRFENFGTGRRPTVLKLRFEDGRYLIDEERTANLR